MPAAADAPSSLSILGLFLTAIATVVGFVWIFAPSLSRSLDAGQAELVMPWILSAVGQPPAQATSFLNHRVRAGRGYAVASRLGMVFATPDGDHSQITLANISPGVCQGMQDYAKESGNSFSILVISMPGHTWHNAGEVQATDCLSLPHSFTMTLKKAPPAP